MVSKASEDLPEPDRPVMTTSESRGRTTLTSLRLCSRAPETTMEFCRDDIRLPSSLRRAPDGKIEHRFDLPATSVRCAAWSAGIRPAGRRRARAGRGPPGAAQLRERPGDERRHAGLQLDERGVCLTALGGIIRIRLRERPAARVPATDVALPLVAGAHAEPAQRVVEGRRDTGAGAAGRAALRPEEHPALALPQQHLRLPGGHLAPLARRRARVLHLHGVDDVLVAVPAA